MNKNFKKRIKFISGIFLMLFGLKSYTQFRVLGQPIKAETEYGLGGLDLNSDGTILALNDVSKIDVNNIISKNIFLKYNGSSWEKISEGYANIIPNKLRINASGNRLLISDDTEGVVLKDLGYQLRVGRVEAYEFKNDKWILMGSPFEGTETYQQFGFAIDISASGNRIIIGDPFINNKKGRALIYEFIENKWVQIGQDITEKTDFPFGPPYSISAGFSVAISADGNRVAVSSPNATTGQTGAIFAGSVSVYDFDATTKLWKLVGNKIIGKGKDERIGSKLVMNSAGTRLALTAVADNLSDPNTTNQVIEAYELKNGEWVRLGDDIVLPNAIDIQYNFEMSIDDSGNYIAYGNSDSENFTNLKGSAAVYELVNGKWQIVNQILTGSALNSRVGRSISVSGNGKVFAVVEVIENNSRNIVTPYCIKENLFINDFKFNNTKVYPNPSSSNINIDFLEEQENINLKIINNLGKIVLFKNFNNVKNILIDHGLPTGFYIMNVENGNNLFQHKLIVK